MYGKHTNLAIAEYWRWWVVHLWVEGFFEVFATVVIAFLFARLKLVSVVVAGRSTMLAATIFLSGGIIGTLHHLYFSGTPTIVLALGSVFSALEVVPLVFVGYEAWENIRLSTEEGMGHPVQMADLLLRLRGILEHGRRGPVRVHDQSAHRALLHAGIEYDAGAWHTLHCSGCTACWGSD